MARTDGELAGFTRKNQTLILKIHGGWRRQTATSQTNADPSEDLSDIVVTRDDYDQFFEKRPGMAAYLESQLLTSTGVIVGYSLEDPHFRALFTRIGRIRRDLAPAKQDSPSSHRMYFLTMEQPRVESYWRHRGIEPVIVGANPQQQMAFDVSPASQFRRFVSKLSLSVEHRLQAKRIPSDFLESVAVRQALESFSADQIESFLVLLGTQGVVVPSSLAQRVTNLESLRRFLSPESFENLTLARGDSTPSPRARSFPVRPSDAPEHGEPGGNHRSSPS